MDKNDIFRREFEKIKSPDPKRKLNEAVIELARVYGKDVLGTEDVDYEKPKFRTAYMYQYHDRHAQLSTMALRLIANKRKRCPQNLRQETSTFDPSTFLADLRGKEILTVTSIGGGSGSDLAGFYRFWSEEDTLCGLKDDVMRNLRLINLDFYEGWKECSADYMRLLGADEFYRFVRADVLDETRENAAIVQGQMKISDLVIMCRFLSAVFFHPEGLKNHIERMVRDMRPRAYLLLIDNMYDSWGVECLKWMKKTLISEPQDVECALLLHYGNSSFKSKGGYGLRLDPDLQQEVEDQYKKYKKNFEFLDPYEPMDPEGVGFQLWQRI